MKIQDTLSALNSLTSQDLGTTRESLKKEVKNSFLEALKSAIEKVDELQKEADQFTTKALTGQGVDFYEAILSMQKADLSVQLLSTIKNKIIKAYEELTRIQV